MTKKTALIIGGCRGLGVDITQAVAKTGLYDIALSSSSMKNLEDMDDQIQAFGLKAKLIPLDLRNLALVPSLAQNLADLWGRIDLLVIASGLLGGLMPAQQIEDKILRQVMEVNFFAPVTLVRELFPLMMQAEAPRIVFLSKFPDEVAYFGLFQASKSALNAYAQALALDVPNKLKVHIIDPSWMRGGHCEQAFPGVVSNDEMARVRLRDIINRITLEEEVPLEIKI